MDIHHIIKVFDKFNFNALEKSYYASMATDIFDMLDIQYEQAMEQLHSLLDVDENVVYSNIWCVLCCFITALIKLKDYLELWEMNLLSLSQSAKLKNTIQSFARFTIEANLQPSLQKQDEVTKFSGENKGREILESYSILKFVLHALCKLSKLSQLRLLIAPNIGLILSGLYQIVGCPLKKPVLQPEDTAYEGGDFVMIPEMYQMLIKDRDKFNNILGEFRESIHNIVFVRESMVLCVDDRPLWFRKTISNTLTNIIKMEKGVKIVIAAMLDGIENDSTKSWQAVDVITKLVVSCNNVDVYRQVVNLLDDTLESVQCPLYARIFISCLKKLNDTNRHFVLDKLLSVFQKLCCNQVAEVDQGRTIGSELIGSIRLCRALIFDTSQTNHYYLFNDIFEAMFHIYAILYQTSLYGQQCKDLEEILTRFISNSTIDLKKILDCILFGIDSTVRKDLIVKRIANDEDLVFEQTTDLVRFASVQHLHLFSSLVYGSRKVDLLSYCLQCITNSKEYFNTATLLTCEDEHDVMHNSMHMFYAFFCDYVADTKNQKLLLYDNFDILLRSFRQTILSNCDNKTQLFTVVMILDAITEQRAVRADYLNELFELVRDVKQSTEAVEMELLCDRILLRKHQTTNAATTQGKQEEVDQYLEYVCDPLLTTRGYGLLQLARLLREKDPHAMERKQYLLQLFQRHLKDDDSSICYCAIDGLVELAQVFTDGVLSSLCDEYADLQKNNVIRGSEIRLKLGEVLVKTTKHLHELAPQYKSLLLNTFLNGVRSDDSLHRASSLFNLGRICSVLGYKLGSIVTEILWCVKEAAGPNEKCPQVRRASLSVILHLFFCLQADKISVLQDELLMLYRSLKHTYHNDSDGVVRLHAQFALEQLNENIVECLCQAPMLQLPKITVLKLGDKP